VIPVRIENHAGSQEIQWITGNLADHARDGACEGGLDRTRTFAAKSIRKLFDRKKLDSTVDALIDNGYKIARLKGREAVGSKQITTGT
jgi:hypothetical protein